MPLYLSKFSYTPETWARLIGNPEDRREAARSYIESVGGKLHGFWYSFGPGRRLHPLGGPGQRVHGRGRARHHRWRGPSSSLETTVLLTVEDTIDALRKADQVQYRPPGA